MAGAAERAKCVCNECSSSSLQRTGCRRSGSPLPSPGALATAVEASALRPAELEKPRQSSQVAPHQAASATVGKKLTRASLNRRAMLPPRENRTLRADNTSPRHAVF